MSIDITGRIVFKTERDIDKWATKGFHNRLHSYFFSESNPDQFGSLSFIAHHLHDDADSFISSVRKLLADNPSSIPDSVHTLLWGKVRYTKNNPLNENT